MNVWYPGKQGIEPPSRRELELEEAIASGWTPCPESENGHQWRQADPRYPWAGKECVACGRNEHDRPDDFCEVVGSDDQDREWVVMNGTRDECEAWIEYRRSDYPYERVGYSIDTLERSTED